MDNPKMLWRSPPNGNVSEEHIPADWDWRIQVARPEMVGQMIGRYEIQATLNEATNANGQCYRAFDKAAGKAVTVKVLSYWLEDSPESSNALGLFYRDARLASALNHPNIATVFETGTYEGRAYLALEVLEGNILRQKLKAGRVTRNEFFHLGDEIASAMATAHAHGMLFRFLHPASIFVTAAGDAKILDFGVEWLRQADWDLERPDGSCWMDYRTPEWFDNHQAEPDPRTDLYLLGLLLYELATCRVPFSTNFLACVKEQPAPLAEADHLSSKVHQLILRLLEKEPEARFQSAREVCQALSEEEHSSQDQRDSSAG